MTADRFRECLDALGWSQHGLADLLDIQFSTVTRWAMGVRDIPPHIADWLEVLAQCHEANPPPTRPGSPR